MSSSIDLLSQLTSIGASIALDGDELLVRAPSDAISAELHRELIQHKPELLKLLRAAAKQEPLASLPDDNRGLLSHAQQRLWFLDQIEPESAVWNVASVFAITGQLDEDALERALTEVLARHSVLRSTFGSTEGIPYARIDPNPEWRLEKVEAVKGDALAAANAAAMELIDLQTGSMFRAVLLEAGPEEFYFTLVIHHMVCDGWSLGLLARELSALYNALRSGLPSPLSALRSQYSNYVDWERETSAQASTTDIEWWKQRLAGPLPQLELGSRRGTTSTPRHAGSRTSVTISAALTGRLHLFAREHGATAFMVLLTAFKVLLFRYTEVDDIVLGTVSSYRKRQEFEELVGMFANPVVLRTSLAGDPSFRESIDRVRGTVLSSFAHDTLPFDRLVEEIHPERSASHQSLFQVSFAYQNLPRAELVLDGIRVAQQRVEIPYARHDLSVEIWTTDEGLTCDFEFRTALFDNAAIERMQAHYLSIIQSGLANADAKISRLALLSDAEQIVLASGGLNSTATYPEEPIHSLFEAQSERNPAASALVDGVNSLNYRELDTRANALCAELESHGVGRGTTVALLIERSAESIVSMLAILKCGAAYLVLDTEYPEERLRFLVQDAGAEIVLLNSSVGARRDHWPAEFTYVDINSAALTHHVVAPARSHGTTTIDDPMCLLYTSGSTGVPKGVEINHRGLVRLLFSPECGSFGRGEAVLHMAPESFDASLLEIWGPLAHGGCVVICRERHPNLQALKALLETNAVRAAWLTSSLLNMIVDELPETLASLERIFTGGESLSVPHIRQAYKTLPNVAIFNGYGPTEATVFTCLYAIPRELPEEVTSIPIGMPVANTRVYVLDSNRQIVPAGVPGELYIGGDALALGYRNRPELNAEKFVYDSFAGHGCLYRSGDRCAYLPDGNLEFLGRFDSQVKVRGHRVEPGEIEATIARQPGVSGSAVTVRRDPPRGDMIVAWFTGESSLQADKLNAALKSELPPYMVPALLLRLESLPLLPNGKVDRAALAVRALPDAASSGLAQRLETGLERDIIRLIGQAMAELLGVQSVRQDDDFFALGGHSLLAMQLAARIEALLGRRVSAALLFQCSTPETIARFLEDESVCRPRRLLPLRASETGTPLFCLHLLLDGTIHDYLALVRCLDSSRPVYGLCPGDFDLERKRRYSLSEIAAEYIGEIKSVRPSGPYHLCGYSSAGILAFEMARQLRREGHNVNLLLLDSFPPATVRSLSLVQMFKMARVFMQSRGRRHIVGRLLLRTRREFQEKVAKFLRRLLTGQGPEKKDRDTLLIEMLNKAMNTYRSRRYSGAATLFKAEQEGHYQRFNFDGCNNWRRLARGGVDLRFIPGNHRQIMQHPSVELLAEELQRAMSAD